MGTTSFVGQHLAHGLVFGGWGLALAIVLIWPTNRGAQSEDHAGGVAAGAHGWIQGAFLGLAGAAVIHIAVMPAHFQESALYGLFFVFVAIAQAALAGTVLVRPSRRLLSAGAVGSIALVALWLASRFVAFPFGPTPSSPEAFGVLDVLASTCEAGVAFCCLASLKSAKLLPSWRWSEWSLSLRFLLLATSIGVPLLTTLAPKG